MCCKKFDFIYLLNFLNFLRASRTTLTISTVSTVTDLWLTGLKNSILIFSANPVTTQKRSGYFLFFYFYIKKRYQVIYWELCFV